jgi:hypothetical protein
VFKTLFARVSTCDGLIVYLLKGVCVPFKGVVGTMVLGPGGTSRFCCCVSETLWGH